MGNENNVVWKSVVGGRLQMKEITASNTTSAIAKKMPLSRASWKSLLVGGAVFVFSNLCSLSDPFPYLSVVFQLLPPKPMSRNSGAKEQG